MRRAWLVHNTGHALDAAAEMAFAPEETRGNIENLVGATHVPLGIGGPIRVKGQHADGLFFVPFATTEGTLVTTYQYGMRAITEAGGANAYVAGGRARHHPLLRDGHDARRACPRKLA